MLYVFKAEGGKFVAGHVRDEDFAEQRLFMHGHPQFAFDHVATPNLSEHFTLWRSNFATGIGCLSSGNIALSFKNMLQEDLHCGSSNDADVPPVPSATSC